MSVVSVCVCALLHVQTKQDSEEFSVFRVFLTKTEFTTWDYESVTVTQIL